MLKLHILPECACMHAYLLYIGSAPASALFFVTYNTLKQHIQTEHSSIPTPVTHMIAACSAEVPACLVRVPTEVLKQRMQAATGTTKPLARDVIRSVIAANGIFGLYKGFGVTIMREIPFSFIQFPLYEYIKTVVAEGRGGQMCSEFEAACVGSISGGIAAAATTPLDVIKTRLMLGVDSHGVAYKSAHDVFSRILQQEGWRTLFAGITPRVTWISIGGFVYFGAYNYSRSVYMKLF